MERQDATEKALHRLTRMVAELKAENAQLRRGHEAAPAQASCVAAREPREPPARDLTTSIDDMVAAALERAVGADAAKRRRVAPAAATVAEDLDASGDESGLPAPSTPASPAPSARPKSPRRPPAALAEPPASVTPALHRAFFRWLGSASTLKATTPTEEWAKNAARHWSHEDWCEKAAMRGPRKCPAKKDALVLKALRHYMTVGADEPAPIAS